MRVGLAQSNLDNAHEMLMHASDPKSPNFGQYLTQEQVINIFRPSDETVDTVRHWLVAGGISNSSITHSDNKAWLAFYATAEQAEKLLLTEYFDHEDAVTGGILPACEQYHVPKHVQPHIDYITPGVKLLAPSNRRPNSKRENRPPEISTGKREYGKRENSKPSNDSCPQNNTDLSTCDIAITPACVAALYNIPTSNLSVNPNNSLGIYESDLQFWAQADLDLFFSNYTNIPNGTHPIDVLIDGAVATTTKVKEAGGEVELDLQLAYPIVYPQTITVFNEDDLYNQALMPNTTYTGAFNTFLDAIDGSYCTYTAFGETGDAPGIDPTYPDPTKGGYNGTLQCGVYKPTNVISISYGSQEAWTPIAYQKRQCNELLKLGLQGVSIIFASGDSGVAAPPPGAFPGDHNAACLGPKQNIFNPGFPCTCPYVTNVGATKIYPGYSVYDPESAAYDPQGDPYENVFASGGGFSNVYPIPDYQAAAVATFFADHNPPYPFYSGLVPDAPNPAQPDINTLAAGTDGVYNRIGRGNPDVSANGDNIATVTGGQYFANGGTSASTPIFASMINRLVEERLAIGKGALGFLNPALYAHPWALNDIVNGSNPGCNTWGFSAVAGWDPVTGLGTPNYPKMRELFVNQLP